MVPRIPEIDLINVMLKGLLFAKISKTIIFTLNFLIDFI